MSLNWTELLQNTRKVSNVSIICCDGQLDTHKIVVASASEFIKQLMIPIPTGDEITILLPDYKMEQVEQILHSVVSSSKADEFASLSSKVKPEVKSVIFSFHCSLLV